MFVVALLGVLVCSASSLDFPDGITIRILSTNYLNKHLAGGIRFGVGYGVPLASLDTSKIQFKKFGKDFTYHPIPVSQIGSLDLETYEEAVCDSEHEDNDPSDGVVDEGCFPAIKGFIAVRNPACGLEGAYSLEYGRRRERFDIVVRGCQSRYDWFEDEYWSDGDSDADFESYYKVDNGGAVYLGVNEDNFLSKGMRGGFRLRVGGESLDKDQVKVYQVKKGTLPDEMELHTRLYQKTCNDASDSDLSSSDSDSEPGEMVCRPAIYGFVQASPATCPMQGHYYLDYLGHRTKFEVHVKGCGDEQWHEYDSDYLYDSDDE